MYFSTCNNLSNGTSFTTSSIQFSGQLSQSFSYQVMTIWIHNRQKFWYILPVWIKLAFGYTNLNDIGFKCVDWVCQPIHNFLLLCLKGPYQNWSMMQIWKKFIKWFAAWYMYKIYSDSPCTISLYAAFSPSKAHKNSCCKLFLLSNQFFHVFCIFCKEPV